jgi:type IV secretion system protein VirB5
MSFSNGTTSYGNHRLREAFDTPYAKAAHEWDRRMGLSIVQARGWRRMALAAWIVAAVLAIGLVVQSQNKQVATYVVPVNELGQPGKITLASEAYQPTAAQAGYFVAEVVRLSRSRSLDPVVTRDGMMKVYHFLAGDGITQMNQLASADPLLNDMSKGQRVARSVEIASVLQRSPSSFQVRWTETEFASGLQRARETYTGLFETKLVAPKREDVAFNNPLGLYVTSFTWSREFTAPTPPTAAALPDPDAMRKAKDESSARDAANTAAK